jgi:hypothetical protein
MATQEQIVYTVLTRGAAGWQPMGQVLDMHTALRAAEQFAASRKYVEVKVDKEFFDAENNRMVHTTILNRACGQRFTLSQTQLFLLLALVGGIASFAITYVVAIGFTG